MSMNEYIFKYLITVLNLFIDFFLRKEDPSISCQEVENVTNPLCTCGQKGKREEKNQEGKEGRGGGRQGGAWVVPCLVVLMET